MQKTWRIGSRFLLGDAEELMGIHLRKVCGISGEVCDWPVGWELWSGGEVG